MIANVDLYFIIKVLLKELLWGNNLFKHEQ